MNDSNQDFISVVIPVYNSQATIEILINELKKSLTCFRKYQVVLVNDFSTDESWNTIEHLAQSNKNILAVNLSKNIGQQAATFLGLKYAKGDYIIIMDDDLAHNSNDILHLYSEIKHGFDAVYAINKKDCRSSKVRSMGSKIRDITIDILSHKPKGIYVSSFRIITNELSKKIISSDKRFVYISLEILRYTNKIKNIYVDYKQGSPTNYTFKKLALLIRNMYIYYSGQKIIKAKKAKPDECIIENIINGETL